MYEILVNDVALHDDVVPVPVWNNALPLPDVAVPPPAVVMTAKSAGVVLGWKNPAVI